MLALSATLAGAARADQARCAKLQGQSIAASVIGLPTGGAVITSAELVAPGPEPASGPPGQGPSGPTQPNPEFCRVLGEIKPVDPSAPVIQFEVNLPSSWNGIMIQRGGAGTDGILVTGLGALSDDLPDTPSALTRGYATFGGDSGHHYPPGQNPFAPNYDGPNPSDFASNRESLVNYAYASIKKTHDVAVRLATLFYAKAPAKMYFIGGSEGGREALVAVEKFPDDYDGAMAEVPLLEWTGTNLVDYSLWKKMMDGGWLSPAKVALVQSAALAACDKMDGLQDGVLADYLSCNAGPATKALRCPGGADTGDTCLSDKQIAFVAAIRSPFHYAFPLANGQTEYPGFPSGNEAGFGSYIPFITPPMKPAPDDKGKQFIGVGVVRGFIFQDDEFAGELDQNAYKARIQEISALLDMNNPDLSAYRAHGGKLIIIAHGSDYSVPPGGVYRYYRNVVAKMGKPTADRFVRMYVAPGLVHFGVASRTDGSPVPNKVDMLAVLANWTEHNVPAPHELILASFDKAGKQVASWPMCQYGAYPHYHGSGDPKAASSFSCKLIPAAY
jgi:feruloyl esterase